MYVVLPPSRIKLSIYRTIAMPQHMYKIFGAIRRVCVPSRASHFGT
uniref:MIP15665p n=1 Tax=Drosophila melanogaster TaxID=7227 RepID=D1Z3A6_DROME|nr:MIP15665p [Drosophila melanogaster]